MGELQSSPVPLWPVCQPRLAPPPLISKIEAHHLTQGEAMTQHARRTALHRRRDIRSTRFPYVRFATVKAASKRLPFSPSLRLQGDWLTEAGFMPHWRVRITVYSGKLVIEPVVMMHMLLEVGASRCSVGGPWKKAYNDDSILEANLWNPSFENGLMPPG